MEVCDYFNQTRLMFQTETPLLRFSFIVGAVFVDVPVSLEATSSQQLYFYINSGRSNCGFGGHDNTADNTSVQVRTPPSLSLQATSAQI